MEVDPVRRRIVARVLERLSTAYNKDFSAEQIRLWYHQTQHLNEEAALATADECIANHKWLPTLSEFLEVSRAVRRKQEANGPKLPREQGEHIKELQDKGLKVQRALIESRQGAVHDHKNGSAGCPVCSQATSEKNEDECRTCYMLESEGIKGCHS